MSGFTKSIGCKKEHGVPNKVIVHIYTHIATLMRLQSCLGKLQQSMTVDTHYAGHLIKHTPNNAHTIHMHTHRHKRMVRVDQLTYLCAFRKQVSFAVNSSKMITKAIHHRTIVTIRPLASINVMSYGEGRRNSKYKVNAPFSCKTYGVYKMAFTI